MTQQERCPSQDEQRGCVLRCEMPVGHNGPHLAGIPADIPQKLWPRDEVGHYVVFFTWASGVAAGVGA